MLRFAAVLALATVTQFANAQAFKCKVDGKVVYQGTPCATEGVKVNTSGAGEAQENSPSSSYLKREGARLDFEDKVDAAIRNQRIFVGMTRGHVKKSWGDPTTINKTITGSSVSEQWVYRKDRIGDTQYVYLRNGVVESMQSPDKP